MAGVATKTKSMGSVPTVERQLLMAGLRLDGTTRQGIVKPAALAHATNTAD